MIMGRFRSVQLICFGFIFLLPVKKNHMSVHGKDCTRLLKDNFKINPESFSRVEEEVRKLYFGDKQVCSSTTREAINVIHFSYQVPVLCGAL